MSLSCFKYGNNYSKTKKAIVKTMAFLDAL